jgi:hypothetical protein
VAVVNGAWWSAWWGWMAAWLAAAAGVVVLAVFLATLAYRWLRRPVMEHSGLSICVYLHDQSIMNLYEMGNYTAALEKAVEERRNVTTTAGLWAKLPFVVKADKGRTQEMFTSYVQKATPISVVGMLLSVFERKDAIVYVDLPSGTITPNRALARKLAAAGDGEAGPQSVALSDIAQFVSVEGRFRAERETADSFVLRARYGSGDEPARLKVAFAATGLQIDKMYEGEIQARCLGKMTGWNPETREVTLDAIAIFR